MRSLAQTNCSINAYSYYLWSLRTLQYFHFGSWNTYFYKLYYFAYVGSYIHFPDANSIPYLKLPNNSTKVSIIFQLKNKGYLKTHYPKVEKHFHLLNHGSRMENLCLHQRRCLHAPGSADWNQACFYSRSRTSEICLPKKNRDNNIDKLPFVFPFCWLCLQGPSKAVQLNPQIRCATGLSVANVLGSSDPCSPNKLSGESSLKMSSF